MDTRGCCLILSCAKESYEIKRFRYWEESIQYIADRMPVFYVFGTTTHACRIPIHPNVFKIVAPCGDHYEDIPMKMYYGYRYLSYIHFDFIIKLDENICIRNVTRFVDTVSSEATHHDYIAINGIGRPENRKDILSMSMYHSSKVHDKRFAALFMPVVHVHYAVGPAYVLSCNAYSKLRKQYFQGMYEDYAVGLNMHISQIPLKPSCIMGNEIAMDSDVSEYSREISLLDSEYYAQICREYNSIPERQTLIMILTGGLGNQLFQIATGMSHCLKHDMNLVLYETQNTSRPYYWDTLLTSFKKNVTSWLTAGFSKYKESTFSYMALPDTGNVIMDGYFQSSKYFPMYKHSLRNMLSFPKNALQSIRDKYGDILNTNTVVVHARRGDYIAKESYHRVLPESYYISARATVKARLLTPTPTFVLISDEPAFWSTTSIFRDDNVVYFNESDILTLYLLIHSKHIIMANSTFSWWGAYLSYAETVITPAIWFGPIGPKDTSDIYEPDWIRI
jgi:hypothetical protein